MFTLKRLIGGSLFVFVIAGTALAQENRAPIDNPREPVAPIPAAPLVTAAATAERVRFVSPGSVVRLRLEVYNEAGQSNVPGFAQFQFYPATGPNANMSFTVVPRGAGVASNKAQFSIFGHRPFCRPHQLRVCFAAGQRDRLCIGLGKIRGRANTTLHAGGGISQR